MKKERCTWRPRLVSQSAGPTNGTYIRKPDTKIPTGGCSALNRIQNGLDVLSYIVAELEYVRFFHAS